MKPDTMTRPPRRPPLLLVALLAVALPAPAWAASPKEVNDAIDRAVKYLYAVQQPEGNWELTPAPTTDERNTVHGKQWGGLTAMATYALLAAGQNPQKPELAKAIDFLLDADINGTYALGLRAQVWQFLPEKHPRRSKIRQAVNRDRDLLLNGFSTKKDDSFGFYGYFPGEPDWYDRSNSQYAVLGMWACEQAGGEVPRKYWEIQDEAWRKAQNQDGGWNYQGKAATGANMTAAGVATLFITQDFLFDLRRDCQGNLPNNNIEGGLAWMDHHIGELLAAGNYYGMYGVERIGVAGGRKYFGPVDWYQAGAEVIVKNQGEDGAWGGDEEHRNPRKVPDTCFALYFLTRGRAPIVMNKLEYGVKEGKGNWNQRPRDLSNFSKWMVRNLDNKFVNWQVVSLKGQPHELHDAPILYVTGSDALAFSDEEVDKLRRFVEQGGMILFNADCGNPKFTRSITGQSGLAHKLFPNYEFRDLPATHPILSGQQFSAAKWKRKPRVMALGNGVRELMLLVPLEDLSKGWQTLAERTREEAYQFGANAYLYSVRERGSGYKGETYIVRDSGEGKPQHAVRVARLMAGTNPDPEPGGWRRLAHVMKNDSLAALTVEPVKPGEGRLKDYKVAHLTGTTKFRLTPEARQEVKAFTDGGGTLIVDAAGASADFAESATDELAAVYGESARKTLAQALSPTHAVYTMSGLAIPKVDYRLFARSRMVGKLNAPRVAALESNGRAVVFFSREDLSCGLVGVPVDGVVGYSPDTATAIMRNLLVYADTAGKGYPPPPKEAPKDKPAQGGAEKSSKDASKAGKEKGGK